MPSPPPTSRYFSPAPHLEQFGVDAGGFGYRVLHLAYVGDLAAQVEVEQFERVAHPPRPTIPLLPGSPRSP